MSFLKKLFCCHEWKEIERKDIIRDYTDGRRMQHILILYCCKKCGKFTREILP